MSVERPVYLVMYSEYEDEWEIYGIFSTEKEAKDFCTKKKSSYVLKYILNRPDLQAQEIE